MLRRLPCGRRHFLISCGLVITIAAIIVGNMPDSALKSELGRVTDPLLTAAGLYQGWGVFAEPRTVSAYVDGRVDFTDGTSTTIPMPDRSGLGAEVDYRWQKYMEVIRPDDGAQYWPAYAQYLATRASGDGRTPLRVTLIRRWARTLPPGPGPERSPWSQDVMGVFETPAAP